ncbi:MAG: FG-GAP-like repeat-containing protein [Chitinophagales bacterium]
MKKLTTFLSAIALTILAFSQTPIPDLIIDADQTFAHLGNYVSSAGDVNADGYMDVVIGAWMYDYGEAGEGRIYIHHGSATGINITPQTTIELNQHNANFGRSVACAGDINGDGYDDIIVGASGYNNGQSNEGAAYIYLGSSTGINLVPNAIIESDQAQAEFGTSVASAGDINGDGYDDVIVGAPYFDNGQTDEGRAYVYLGSSTGINTTPAIVLESNDAVAYFGYSVSGAGDINNDGYDDIIIGAHKYSDGIINSGKVFIYHGSATGINATPTLIMSGVQANELYGISVSSAGDINGDGYGDIIVGADNYTNGQDYEGQIYIYHGTAGGLNATPMATIEGNQSSAHYGISVASAGDVNSDGFGDVVVGAEQFVNVEYGEGRGYLYFGSISGLITVPQLTMEPNKSSSYFGSSVASAGDVDNDGDDDIIIGAPSWDDDLNSEGGAFIYLSDFCVAVAETCNSLDDDCNGSIDDDIIETINISADDPTIFCQGGSVLLTATYSGTSVQWKKNGTNIPGAISSTYSVIKSGNYTAVTTSPCGTATSSLIHVTVNKNPPASITAAGATTFCAGGSVILTANSGAGLSYQWYKNGTAITGATAINYTAITAGNYKCRVTKTASGCFKNSNTITVTVPCREGFTADEHPINSRFEIYPNPNNGTFTITSELISEAESTSPLEGRLRGVTIYNSLGEVVFSKELCTASSGNSNDGNINETISLENIPSGIYFIRLQNGIVYSEQKLIIE